MNRAATSPHRGFVPGTDRVLVIGALFLNGVGWNLAFVSGSAAGGMILGAWGFAILNTLGAALVLGPLALSLLRWPAITALSTREG